VVTGGGNVIRAQGKPRLKLLERRSEGTSATSHHFLPGLETGAKRNIRGARLRRRAASKARRGRRNFAARVRDEMLLKFTSQLESGQICKIIKIGKANHHGLRVAGTVCGIRSV